MKIVEFLLCRQVKNAEKSTSSYQHACSWYPVTLSNNSRWIPAQKHTGMTGIKTFCLCLLYPSASYAHHSKDHLMLFENSEKIILNTQQGSQGGLFWILWSGVFILVLLGFVRWWKQRL